MKDFHIAVVGHPMPPNVGPSLPLVAVLVRRGYRVTYVTSSKFFSRVSATGAQVVEIPLFTPVFQHDPRWTQRFQHPFCRSAIKALEITTARYADDKPNLILYDMIAFAGRILSATWNIPAIQISPTFALRRETLEQQFRNADWRREVVELADHADRFLTHYSVNSRDFLFHRERLNIYFAPKALQPEGDVFGNTCFYAGRCAGEQLYYGQWQKARSHNRPVVFVSTSTAYLQGPGFFRLCVEALTALNYHVILSIGDHFDTTSLGSLPSSCEVVQGIAHVMILPHVDLFICLGGNITAAEAAYYGVPMIVTSHGFPELEYQGDNIERLKLGLHLRKDALTLGTLQQAVAQIFADKSILSRVREVKRVVRKEPGAEETANRIEDYIEDYCDRL